MKRSDNRGKEIMFIVIVWTIVFAVVPLAMLEYLTSGSDTDGAIHHVSVTWLGILPFFILFMLHHFLLGPLFYKKKWSLYIPLALLLVGVFAMWCIKDPMRPDGMRPEFPGPPPSEQPGGPEGQQFGPGPEGQPFPLRPEEFRPEDSIPPGGREPLSPQYTKLFMALLICGADLGLMAYLAGIENERRMQELETENLNSRLETLRYQINPHFFMNTLNNIHALVELDPAKARESIEQLSKLMRIVLYEGSAPTIPLSMELDYLKHYISLMRLRYPEELVRIETCFPDDTEGIKTPPLIMASFAENAFKHGISYEKESFVHLTIERQEHKLVFKCVNSNNSRKSSAPDDGQHGLGLENIRNRLELLYGKDYTLHVEENSNIYESVLVIPHTPLIRET